MQKKALLLVALALLCVPLLFADVALEPVTPKTLVNRGGSVCDAYAHIQGFGQYPKVQFYLVETIRDGSVLAFSQVIGDSITVDEMKYSLKPSVTASKYISWDPVLADLKPGQEYKLKDVKLNLPGSDNRGIDYGRSQRQSIELPLLDYIGFARIDDYYGIQWHDPDVHSFYSEYELEWRSQVWQHPQFLIRGGGEDANWYDISDFLSERTLEQNDTYEFWEMQKDDLMELLAWVPTKPGWELILKEPLDKVKVYYHKGTGTTSQNYSLPMRVPILYRMLAVVLTILVCGVVIFLFYKVMFKGSGRES